MRSSSSESRLTGLLRRTRLQPRLLAVCLLLSLVPVLVVGAFAFQVYTRSINRNLAQSAEQAVRLLNATVVSELGKFTAYINTISVSNDVQSILLRPEAERILPDGSVTQAIKQNVQQVPAQSRYLRNILVVDRAGNVLYDFGFDDIPRAVFRDLLTVLDETTPNDALQYVRTYRGVDTLVLGRKIYEFAHPRNPIGYILVYMHEALLSENVFADVDFGLGSNILLMDGKGRVLSSQDDAMLGADLSGSEDLLAQVRQADAQGQKALNTSIDGEGHLIVFDYSRDIDTYFLATIPEAVITAETRQITGRLVLVAALTVLASLVVAMLLYRSITGPIRRIVAFCNEATQDKTQRHIEDPSPDELGYLTRAVDTFVHRIQALLQKSKQDGRRKRELELEMLQYQINPHFLFNTLNTLQWVAMLNEVPVLEEGISSLSQLLQRTLLRTEESIPLREELENLQHYVAIQKIRYADCFQVDYEVEEGLEEVLVPRFILQPLVENAILHGTREGGGSIMIIVSCRRGEDRKVLLSVRDDGQGFVFDAEKQAREGFSGIGLRNVQERIRLSFGEPYGLTITSAPGQGTRCLITLPAHAGIGEEGEDAPGIVGG